MRIVTVSCAALALLLAPQVAAQQVSTSAKQPKANKDRVVCRTTMITGTRFEKRACKTASEWQEQEELHKERWREQLSRPASPPDLKG